MLHDYLQVYTISIVFLGDFNPVIVQPYWLANKKLIRDQEAQSAEVEIIHSEISKFKIKDWLSIEITRDRFELRTSQEPYFAPMKDLAISIFKSLNETPIKAVGVNHLKYFAITNEDDYYKFGDKLAPLNNWSGFINSPKLLNLEIVEQKRKDKLNGSLRIRVQPSDLKLSTKYGILININDHFATEASSKGRDGEVIKMLGENWSASLDRSTEIVESIWQNVQK